MFCKQLAHFSSQPYEVGTIVNLTYRWGNRAPEKLSISDTQLVNSRPDRKPPVLWTPRLCCVSSVYTSMGTLRWDCRQGKGSRAYPMHQARVRASRSHGDTEQTGTSMARKRTLIHLIKTPHFIAEKIEVQNGESTSQVPMQKLSGNLAPS